MCFEDVFFSGKNPFKTLSLINEEAVAELSTSEGEKMCREDILKPF